MCSLQLQSQPFLNLCRTNSYPTLSKSPSSLPFFSTSTCIFKLKFRASSSPVQEFPPNALRRKSNPQWRGGFSLGVDLGLSRTGLALSKGFSVRPLTVLKLRGQKLELQLLEIAENEEADEFIIGLPKSWDGKETPQSNKVRSLAGRLAVRAAERGWRVYLQDEHGTSTDAAYRMINLGLSKSARQKSSDAYAAVILLERYFAMSGEDIEIVLPKQMDLQEKLRRGAPLDIDFS
ncbi:Putative pre-16S rRNA nuclease - like 1 [Theobroma cacao]|nr:Putative pre-16S rRNA nuclease - like 1 [Theobroma cacao]